MVLRLSELNGEKREEFPHPKVGFITSTFNISISTFFVGFGTFELDKFFAGCLGPDDNIYFTPAGNIDNSYVLKFDTKTGTATSVGSFPILRNEVTSTPKRGGASINGLVCGQDGNIYTIPGNQRSVIKIDPISQSFTTFSENFGGFEDDADSSVLNTKWLGGCLSTNGKIYGIPYTYDKILVINPKTGTASTSEISTGFTTSFGKWAGGVLSSDGNIYGIPWKSTTILKINPTTNTTSTFGSVTGGWWGGCLAPNGKIYCSPYDGNKTKFILKIDSLTDTITTIGPISDSLFTDNTGWQGAVLAPNGKIYCSPLGGKGILEIDPQNDTFNVIGIGSLPSLGQYVFDSYRWSPFVLSPDGKMYAPPAGETKMLVLGETSNQEPADWLLSPYCNKGP
jgi:hypothetical protein